MNRINKFLVSRQQRATKRLAVIATFQAEARDEMLEMRDLIVQVKETVVALEDLINANTT